MACIALMTVEPTDRALTGWQPFGTSLRGLTMNATSDEVLRYLEDVGAG